MYAARLKPLNYPWPPVVYVLAITLAVLMGHIASLPALHSRGYVVWLAGGTLVVLAAAIDIWAVRTLWAGHTTAMPHRCANRLVTGGPYRYSRNPIYLGYTLITLALGLLSGNIWFFAAAPAAAIVTSLYAISREEKHLHARFGADFERYCQRTRRWL